MSNVRIFCQDGQFQTEVTADTVDEVHVRMYGIDPYHPSKWYVRQSRQDGYCNVVTVYKGYQMFQVAVYASTEDAQAAIDSCREFVKSWKDKPASPDNLPKFQFPPNDKVMNMLPLIKRYLNHNGN